MQFRNFEIRIRRWQLAWIEPDRCDAGLLRADHISGPGITDHDDVVGRECEAVERHLEDPAIGLREADVFRHDQCVDEWRQTALRHLLLLLGKEIVRHDRDAHSLTKRGEQFVRAGNGLTNANVRLSIERRRGCGRLSRVSGLKEEPAEALDARRVDVDRPGEHLQVQRFELFGVGALEFFERRRQKRRVCGMDTLQRGAGPVLMIEQRVVEIEQDTAKHSARRAVHLIPA